MLNPQYEQILCVIIIISCAILLFLPKMLYRPGLILTCLSFIAMSSFSLLVGWSIWLGEMGEETGDVAAEEFYLIITLFFILLNIIYCFIVIKTNQGKIQDDNTHIYYEKFMMTTIWLIFIELVFYYYLFYSILQKEKTSGLYAATIIFFCVLNFFIIRFNSIYFTYFSADG
jgi:hypothetical protein